MSVLTLLAHAASTSRTLPRRALERAGQPRKKRRAAAVNRLAIHKQAGKRNRKRQRSERMLSSRPMRGAETRHGTHCFRKVHSKQQQMVSLGGGTVRMLSAALLCCSVSHVAERQRQVLVESAGRQRQEHHVSQYMSPLSVAATWHVSAGVNQAHVAVCTDSLRLPRSPKRSWWSPWPH